MAFKEIAQLLEKLNWKPEQLVTEKELFAVSRYKSKNLGRLVPYSKKQVMEALSIASDNGCSLYPFSRGNNWAFGGKIPFSSDCLLLDLSQLQAISDYDSEFGRVRVEPGVSQGQLMDFLLEKNSSFYIDVTGSGADTSILGNALERGIAYNKLRAEEVESLEVLLPSGEVIKTGFSGFDVCAVKDLYGFGLGPDLRGLFFQSNLGIVLSIVVRLSKKQEKTLSFQLSIDEKKVGLLVEGISQLMQLDILNCITHIGDPLRVKSTLDPILRSSKEFSEKDREYMFKKLNLNESDNPIWSCIGNIQGTKGVVAAKKIEVKKKLSKLGKVQFFDEEKVNRVVKYLGWGPFKPLANFLKVTKPLRGFVAGEATTEAIKMLYWNDLKNENIKYLKSGHIDVNSTPFATLFCVPLTKMNNEGASKLISVFRQFSKKYNLAMGATLNTLSASVLEAVISIHFDPAARSVDEVHKLFIELNQEYVSNGLYPYRMNPQLMKHSWAILPHVELSSELKKVLDPKNICSPKHYINFVK